MPFAVRRVVVEADYPEQPNQPVTLTDEASGAVLGTGVADGSGFVAIAIPFGLLLGGEAAGVAAPGAPEVTTIIGGGDIAGVAGGAAGAAGTLTQESPLAGAAPGQGGAAGTASVSGSQAGSAAGAAGAAATMRVSQPVAGSPAAGHGGAAATPSVSQPLPSQPAGGVGGAAASLKVSVPLGGAAGGVAGAGPSVPALSPAPAPILVSISPASPITIGTPMVITAGPAVALVGAAGGVAGATASIPAPVSLAGAAAGVGGAVAGPSAFSFSDNFNRSNGAIGNGWVALPGKSLSSIATNLALGASSSGAYRPEATGNDQFASVKYLDPAATEVRVRQSTSADTAYLARSWDDGEGGTGMSLIKVVAGVETNLGDSTSGVPTFARVEAQGTTIRLRESSNGSTWTTTITATDSAITSGQTGFVGTADDFVAGDL